MMFRRKIKILSVSLMWETQIFSLQIKSLKFQMQCGLTLVVIISTENSS